MEPPEKEPPEKESIKKEDNGYGPDGSMMALLIAVVVFIIFVLFSIGLYVRWKGWQEQEKHVPSPEPLVRIMTAKRETQEVSLSLPGYLVGYNVTPILARVDGYVKNFIADIGDKVTSQQILSELETPDIDAEWRQANSELERAIAKKEIAKITAERWSGLYLKDPESISKQEVDQTEADYKAASADVNAAQAHFENIDVLKNFKYVLAPFDGIIVERNIDIGSLVSAGNETMTQPYTSGRESLIQPLFKIARTDILRVFVNVPQPYYPYITDKIQVEVSVPEHPEHIFKGEVDRNAVALDQGSRTLLTQINIENSQALLRPGLYAEVKFSLPPYRNSFNIPIGALIIRDGPPYVAVVNQDDTVSLKEVEIGKDFGKSVLIIKGIEESDRLILNPNYRIKDGVKVKVI